MHINHPNKSNTQFSNPCVWENTLFSKFRKTFPCNPHRNLFGVSNLQVANYHQYRHLGLRKEEIHGEVFKLWNTGTYGLIHNLAWFKAGITGQPDSLQQEDNSHILNRLDCQLWKLLGGQLWNELGGLNKRNLTARIHASPKPWILINWIRTLKRVFANSSKAVQIISFVPCLLLIIVKVRRYLEATQLSSMVVQVCSHVYDFVMSAYQEVR